MKYEMFEDEHYYICHDGQELRHIRTETKEQEIIRRRWRDMGVQTAADVRINKKCLYKYNAEKYAKKRL